VAVARNSVSVVASWLKHLVDEKSQLAVEVGVFLEAYMRTVWKTQRQ
jgi:hypothetical protein